MNHRARKPRFVTQDSDKSEDDVNYRMFNTGRIRCDLRRRLLVPVIPDENDLDNHDSSSGSNKNRVTFNIDTTTSSTSNNQQSTSSSSEPGWLNTRKICSPKIELISERKPKQYLKRRHQRKLRRKPINSRLVQLFHLLLLGNYFP